MFYLTSETVVTPVVDHKTLWRMGIFQMDEYLDTKLQGARCDPGTHPFVPSLMSRRADVLVVLLVELVSSLYYSVEGAFARHLNWHDLRKQGK